MGNKKMLCILWTANVFLPLLAGLAVYILLRPDTLVSGWFYRVLPFLKPEKLPVTAAASRIRRFLSFYVPDMMWAYAFTSTVYLIFGISRRSVLPAVAISIAFFTFTELAQKFAVISGTFDILDILIEAAATALSIIIISLCVRRNPK